MGTLFLLAASAGLAVTACGSTPDRSEGSTGQLALPLSTQGPSGVVYHLRHATFVIHSNTFFEDTAGAGNDTGVVTVNSDDQPDAASLTVALEQGSYDVQLLPGWSFEKDGPDGPETVTATLLSGADQWIWVSPHATTFAEYQFGLGDRAIWFNGKLNIDIVVYETPSQLYGGAGDTGSPGTGGAGSIGVGGATDF